MTRRLIANSTEKGPIETGKGAGTGRQPFGRTERIKKETEWNE